MQRDDNQQEIFVIVHNNKSRQFLLFDNANVFILCDNLSRCNIIECLVFVIILTPASHRLDVDKLAN